MYVKVVTILKLIYDIFQLLQTQNQVHPVQVLLNHRQVCQNLQVLAPLAQMLPLVLI